MSARIIDGRQVAKDCRKSLKRRVKALEARGVVPGLATVLVGTDPASQVYVRTKRKRCEKLGLASFVHDYPEGLSQGDLLALIHRLNEAPDVHAILVQLPLPGDIDSTAVLRAVDPKKDADGFHPENMGLLWMGEPRVHPCTPLGIIRLLESCGVELKGKQAVVVGRSNIVGKPVAAMLTQRHATVTVCHTRTRDLRAEVGKAEVLIVAAGRPEVIPGAWVREGAVVIDVGVNRVEDRLVGDVQFEEAARRASWITPVPGGVGPMTIAMLLENTVTLAENR